MTYCVGIKTHEGLVLAADSRSNAGHDQVNVCRKMYTFAKPGERAFAILASGSLSLTQSAITLLRQDFNAGKGLATAETFYDAVRIVGEYVRRVADVDRAALEKDDYNFNIHLIIGGQIKGEPPQLYLVYPQGNPLHGHQRNALFANRRIQVRPAHSRKRTRLFKNLARIGSALRAALLRRDVAIECHRGTAN